MQEVLMSFFPTRHCLDSSGAKDMYADLFSPLQLPSTMVLTPLPNGLHLLHGEGSIVFGFQLNKTQLETQI